MQAWERSTAREARAFERRYAHVLPLYKSRSAPSSTLGYDGEHRIRKTTPLSPRLSTSPHALAARRRWGCCLARNNRADGLEELETFLRATNIGQRPKLEVEEFVISKKSDSGVLDERIRARLQGVPRSTGDPVTHLIQFIGVR